MVRLPFGVRDDSAFTRGRTQILHDYGAILALWGEMEIAIEIKIAKLAGLNDRTASIMLGGLAFGPKADILFSLLTEVNDEDVIKAVDKVISFTRRNALVHSVMASEPEDLTFTFIKRETRRTHTVSHHTFTAAQFHRHFLKMRLLQHRAFTALGVFQDDLEAYSKAAKLLEPSQIRRPLHPQNERKRSTKAKSTPRE